MRARSPLVACLGLCFSLAAGAAPAWGPLELMGERIAPGQKAKFGFIQTRSFEGSFFDTPIFAARGAKAGPTLCVTAGIHGDELNSIEIARRVFAEVDAKKLSGTLIVLPAINAWGLRTSERYLPDRRDLNRFFPGSPNGSVAAILADRVFRLVKGQCGRLIDLHTASDLRTNSPQIRADMSSPQVRELALEFGVGIVIDGAGPQGSLRREAMNAGIPAIIYEAGPPLVFREEEIARGVTGVNNVLDALSMFETGADAQPSQVLARSFWVRVPPGQGGVFMPTVAVGDRVARDQLLATVVDPLTDEVYEVRASGAGTIVGMALPRIVLSGFGVFHIGELEAGAEEAK
jgi:predicted deacylase